MAVQELLKIWELEKFGRNGKIWKLERTGKTGKIWDLDYPSLKENKKIHHVKVVKSFKECRVR